MKGLIFDQDEFHLLSVNWIGDIGSINHWISSLNVEPVVFIIDMHRWVVKDAKKVCRNVWRGAEAKYVVASFVDLIEVT